MINNLESLVIIKRDGREKPFEIDKIESAISRAYGDIDGTTHTFYNQWNSGMKDNISQKIKNINKNKIDIEDIQDIIISELHNWNECVAKGYEDYRNKREEDRRKRSIKERFYNEVLECSNVDNDNANVDQYSFSGRKYRITDYEQKHYALRNLISKEGRKAFEEGEIYYHDLSSYAIGEFNCMNLKVENGFEHGFMTRNGGVRGANSFSTACQLLAVMFQLESQCQFGGVGASCLDYQLAKQVKKSFKKHFIEGLIWLEGKTKDESESILGNILMSIDDSKYSDISKKAFKYATNMLDKEGKQACEALYHNLNTLESRAGSQLPFTSINLGRDTSPEGRLVNKWIFNASLNGIGKEHRTSIFPISIFQYKKGVNAHEGDPNYDIKKLAINSLCHKIYPNIVNGDYKQVKENPNDYNTFFATMG